MNRKKKEKSVLRKEGTVNGLDLLVKVSSGATAPNQVQAQGSRRNQSSCRRKDNHGSKIRLTAATQFV